MSPTPADHLNLFQAHPGWFTGEAELLCRTEGRTKPVYKEPSILLSTDFSPETLQSRREWHDLFKAMKEGKNVQQEYST